jgi:hypothetical protein
MKNYSSRLERLIRITETAGPIYQIKYCTQAEADALEAQRPPATPGEIRYIVDSREYEPQATD